MSALPEGNLPGKIAQYIYKEPQPVFFGHYWLTGTPVVEAPQALCLDYSAGKSGPLLAYRFDSGQAEMEVGRIVIPGDSS